MAGLACRIFGLAESAPLAWISRYAKREMGRGGRSGRRQPALITAELAHEGHGRNGLALGRLAWVRGVRLAVRASGDLLVSVAALDAVAETHLLSASRCACAAADCLGRQAINAVGDHAIDAFAPLRADARHVTPRTIVSIPLSVDGSYALCRADAWGDLVEIMQFDNDARRRHLVTPTGCTCATTSCAAADILDIAREDGLVPFTPQAAAFRPLRVEGAQGEWEPPYGMAPDLGPTRIQAWRRSPRETVVAESGMRPVTHVVVVANCSCGRSGNCLHCAFAQALAA